MGTTGMYNLSCESFSHKWHQLEFLCKNGNILYNSLLQINSVKNMNYKKIVFLILQRTREPQIVSTVKKYCTQTTIGSAPLALAVK